MESLSVVSSTSLLNPAMALSLAAVIFFIGLFGVMVRRNVLIVLMCVELMLNAVNLTLVTYSHILNDLAGQMSVFFIMAVAAAESAVGLGLIISMFRAIRNIDTDSLRLLKE
jgi:NADH-quinone oxidoreductase subunit K